MAFDKKVAKNDLSNAKIKYIKDKIPYITNLATKAALDAKINKVNSEIPSITRLTAWNFDVKPITDRWLCVHWIA